MKITANGAEIFYNRHLGQQTVILLHGWGGSHKLMEGLYDGLKKCGADIINVDLPGFGQSPPPPAHFTTDDYAAAIREMIAALGLTEVTVIGHSFGGRLAILLGADESVKRIVLIAGAGLKPRFSFKKWLRQRQYKRAKRRGRDLSGYGSKDYQALSGEMRQIFVRVVNRHLDGEINKITAETLLIWGRSDKETPPYMAKKLLRRIDGAGIVWLKGGHFAYLENSRTTLAAVKSFLGFNNS